VKGWFTKAIKGEAGLVLPLVLAMMALGSLVMVPLLNHAATTVNTGKLFEEKTKGIYAAGAGVEDALWKIKNDTPASLPYSYQLVDINGMTVDVVIDEIEAIAGEELGETGGHEDWFQIDKVVTYESGIYSYNMAMSNNGSGNIKIVKIMILFPPLADYVDGSTSGDITTEDPAVSGSPAAGITLVWENSAPLPAIEPAATKEHLFQLSGPPGIEGIEGHGIVEASRDDIGTVWDSDSQPYSITAQAKDDSGNGVAGIRAGVWGGIDMSISCWQIMP